MKIIAIRGREQVEAQGASRTKLASTGEQCPPEKQGIWGRLRNGRWMDPVAIKTKEDAGWLTAL